MENKLVPDEIKNTKNLLATIYSIRSIMDKQDKRKIALLLCIMLLSAIFSAIGITMVVPFITVAANPELIQTSYSLAWLYAHAPTSSPHSFLIFLGFLALVLLVIGNSINIIVGWLSARVGYGMKYKWINNLFSAYLAQPYIYFLNHRTSDASKNLLHTMDRLTREVIIQILDFFAKSFSIIAILAILIIVNPLPALSILFGLGFIYFFIFLGIKNTLKTTNQYLASSAQQLYKIVEETFYVIKEIKLYQKEDLFLQQFELPTRHEQHYHAILRGFTPMPRYLLEIFAFGGIILLVLYLLLAKHSLVNLIPVLGFFVIALYRLMPLTQNVFTALSNIIVGKHLIEEILDAYQKLNVTHLPQLPQEFIPKSFSNNFGELELQDIDFCYPNTQKRVLNNLNLKITAGTMVAIVGPSGSGKSTLVDILLGLLRPQKGKMLVDQTILHTEGQINLWKNLLGYVPQNIMLTHNSIAENIAFGIKKQEVDLERIIEVAKIAEIHDFISELPEQYETLAGEKGVRLSGGQCQRIGIARALYHNPQILLLDEATNALDALTEMKIMQNIHRLVGQKTLIIIAHRLQTVKNCDQIFYLEDGYLVAQGTYNELLKIHPAFHKMVALAAGTSYSDTSLPQLS